MSVAVAPKPHPVFLACQRAPVGAPNPPEAQIEIDLAMAELEDGTAVLVPHEDVGAFLEQLAREP